LFLACIELDVPVLVHTGVPLPSMLLRHGHPFGVDEVANRHPDLQIITAHLGVPWLLETIAVAVRHPNVYLDISALPSVEHRAVGPALTLCVDRGLGDRLLFGSDFPLVDPAAYARQVNAFGPAWLVRRLAGLAKITPSVRAAILGGNAARLLKLTP
jgi:predicted TIM-barrel fold metal-dependent hydrolase